MKGQKLDIQKFVRLVRKYRMENGKGVNPMTMVEFFKKSGIKYNSWFQRIITTGQITKGTKDMLEVFFRKELGKEDFELPMQK